MFPIAMAVGSRIVMHIAGTSVRSRSASADTARSAVLVASVSAWVTYLGTLAVAWQAKAVAPFIAGHLLGEGSGFLAGCLENGD